MFYNELAEQAIIKAIISDNKTSLISEILPEDFYFPDHQKIMKAVCSLNDDHKAIDLVTVDDALHDNNTKNLLVDIATGHYDAWATKSHVNIIKDCAVRRSLYNLLDKQQHELAEHDTDTALVLDTLQQSLRNMNKSANEDWQSMRQVMAAAYKALGERQNASVKPMPFGIPGLDSLTGGLFPGELTLIAARPAVGKSAFGLQVALKAANAGYKVGIISREMTAQQYGTRILQSGVNKALRTATLDQSDWERLGTLANEYSRKNISFLFNVQYIEDLKAAVQREADKDGIDLLIVDYVQLMQSKMKFQQDYQRIGHVSKALKDLSVDLNIAVVGLAQVGRSADGEMPTMGELRGSGDLEQDADSIIILHCPADVTDKYVKYKDLYNSLTESRYIIINVAKQRQGETGLVTAVFNPQRALFSGIEHG